MLQWQINPLLPGRSYGYTIVDETPPIAAAALGGGAVKRHQDVGRENKTDLSSIELSIMAVITYLKQNSRAILGTLHLYYTGEYKVTKHMDTTVKTIISPPNNLLLDPKKSLKK